MKTARALVLSVIIAAAPAHAANNVVPPLVPSDIEVDAGFKPFLIAHAVGTQNYICTPVGGVIKWFFIGPQATLFDAEGGQMLTHFQSKNPFQEAIDATWQHSRDTSAVWARKVAGSSDPIYVAPDAIEWLKLEVKAAADGPGGGDKLTRTMFIQRVNTVGGKEPSTGCSASTLNTRKLVPYQADYVFYR